MSRVRLEHPLKAGRWGVAELGGSGKQGCRRTLCEEKPHLSTFSSSVCSSSELRDADAAVFYCYCARDFQFLWKAGGCFHPLHPLSALRSHLLIIIAFKRSAEMFACI